MLWLLVKKPRAHKVKLAARLAFVVLITQLPIEYLILRYPMVMGEGHYLGIRFLNFPIEDFLFFLTFPMLVFALVNIFDDYLPSKC